mgnify:CR=1 FL=1
MTFKQKLDSGSIKVGIIGLGYVGLPPLNSAKNSTPSDSISKRNASTCSCPESI